jgi:hypothetical protein
VKNKGKKSKAKSKEGSKTKPDLKEGELTKGTAKLSAYKLQREINIAQNKALLTTIKEPEFEKAMGELVKGVAPGSKNNNGEKSKPNPEEEHTSDRLSAADEKWVFLSLST